MNAKSASRLAVEALEGKALLSGVAMQSHVLPPIIVWPNIPAPLPTTGLTIHLGGSAAGDYHAHEIPDAGKFYTFVGSGRVTPLGHVHVQGTVDLPGLLIMPVSPFQGSGQPAQIVPSVNATGQLTLSTTHGSIALSLIAPSHDNAETLPSEFSYSIIKATGTFHGDAGSGKLQITVTPAPAPTPMPTGSAIEIGGFEQGTFHLVFKPSAAS
jgi:hypothetical protein